jgi:endonuclease III
VTPKQKAAKIAAILDQLYPKPRVPLDHDDPYTLLVAVTLAARTRDTRVNEVTKRLFARAKTPEQMRRLSAQEIYDLVQGVFLAQRKAKALHGMAEQLCTSHGGKVPRDLDALVELPGVGPKTAAMVLAAAWGDPYITVDTHVQRLAERWGLSKAKSPEQTERDLARLLPRDHWSRTPIQMILFGQQRCPAKSHDAATCPICSWAVPRKKAKATAKHAKRQS